MKNKKIIFRIGIILLMLGLILSKSNKMPEKDDVLEYLNKTYARENDQFTYVMGASSSNPMPGPTDIYYFRSEKYYQNITIRINKGIIKYKYEDNYYEMYMYDDAIAYFTDIASDLNNYEVKVRFGVNYLDKYLTFEEFNNDIQMDVFYITNYEVDEQQKQELLKKISKKICCGSVYFYVTNDKNLLRYVDLSSIDKFIEYDKTSKYHITTNGDIMKLEY